LLSLLLLIPSVFFAVAPMLVFLSIVWWLDRYDREPIWLLLLTFLWGAIGGVLFGLVGSMTMLTPFLLPGLSGVNMDAVGAVLVAPLCEEPAKAIFLLIVLWNRCFDNTTDGFVYGAAAGLGFGMTENLLYFNSAAGGDLWSWGTTVVVRTFYSAVMHGLSTSLVGAALGFSRFRSWPALIASGILGLGAAMSVHALWNGLLTLDDAYGFGGMLHTLDLVIFPFEVLLAFCLFQLALFDEHRTLRKELEDEASRGTIPKDHPYILSSWIQRSRSHWVPPGLRKDRYIQASTALALRKRQAAMCPGPSGEFYRDEVYRLRRVLVLLLAPPARA
jgi:RsiW-degrading membrane proteinase PrsW (M82 family)